MTKTRFSLYYLVTYLSLTGLGLMLAPLTVLRLLGASRVYDDVMPRFVGIPMVALAALATNHSPPRQRALPAHRGDSSADLAVRAVAVLLFERPIFSHRAWRGRTRIVFTAASYWMERGRT